MKETISKVEVSRIQIEKACELHIQRDFVCSLSLAGSSESLTHELAIARGHDSGDSWHIKFIRFWREKAGLQSPSTKDILNEKNWARNMMKHQGNEDSEEIVINLELESFLAIKRSIENYQRLGNNRTEVMINFNEETRDYG